MIAFLNTHLSRKQRIRLYRLCLILDSIDFSFLRPVFLGTLLSCFLYIGSLLVPYYAYITTSQFVLYLLLVGILTLAFLYYLLPYVRKYRARIRVRMYRRKKRATYTFFA